MNQDVLNRSRSRGWLRAAGAGWSVTGASPPPGSPWLLLANLLRPDGEARELEAPGHRSVRGAGHSNVLVRSRRTGESVIRNPRRRHHWLGFQLQEDTRAAERLMAEALFEQANTSPVLASCTEWIRERPGVIQVGLPIAGRARVPDATAGYVMHGTSRGWTGGGADAHVALPTRNSPVQTVIAGPPDELEESRAAFEARDGRFVPLNTSRAPRGRHTQSGNET